MGLIDDLKTEKLVRFMPQVRTDLMRWAISEYCKKQTIANRGGVPVATKECFEVPDPQFRGGAEGVHTYNVTTLAKIAKVLVQEWKADSDVIHLGFPKGLTQFVFYEDLLQAQEGAADQVERQLEAYGRWILEKLNLKFPKGCHRNVTRSKIAVKEAVEKVHSNDIEEFVKNADAVRELFKNSSLSADIHSGKSGKLWPQWSAVARKMGVPGTIRVHWNRDSPSSKPARLMLSAQASSENTGVGQKTSRKSEPDRYRYKSEPDAVRSAGYRRTRSGKVRTVSSLMPTLPLDLVDVVV